MSSPKLSASHSPHSSKFCPKCGKTSGTFIGLFCRSCFLKDHPNFVSFPEALILERCNVCLKIRPQGKWVNWDDDLVHIWVQGKLKHRLEHPVVSVQIIPNPKIPKESFVRAAVKGEIDGEPVEFMAETTLKVRGAICNDDMLVSSDYYEGIIQVRFTERTPEKIRAVQDEIDAAMEPMRKEDPKAQVVNWILQKHGLDAWVVSRKAAKAAAVAVTRKHEGTMSVSGKLIGLDVHSSKTKNRLTFLVRIP